MQVNNTHKHRRDSAALAGVCLVLQVAVAPYLAVGNGHINFALIFCAIVALTVGGSWGVLCGFFSGLVFDLSTTGPIGLMAFLLTSAAFIMGMESRNRLQDDSSAAMILFFMTCLVLSVSYNLAMFLVGEAHSVIDMLFLRSLPSFILTSVAFLPFAWQFSKGSPHTLSMDVSAKKRAGKYRAKNP